MRIPHYLVRNPSGLFVFRHKVPAPLQPVFGRKVIKHALGTADTLIATRQALDLAARYARCFQSLRLVAMTKKLTPEDVLANVQANGLQRYEIDIRSGRVKVDGADDHARAMEALERLSRLGLLGGGPLPHAPPPALPPAPAEPPAPPVAEVITVGKAQHLWLASIKANTSKKTYSIKKTAIESLARFVGEKTELRRLTRADLARWYQLLRDEEIATPTLTNKQSYIGGKYGFFAWAMASGYYPKGDNPAAGHVSYSANEKRKRRKFGFKAFTMEQIQTLFEPANFARLSFHARWAALIGLYTGARVSEVGQLMVSDIVEIEGIPCFSLTDEGDNQSLKSEPSIRLVPIHPQLVALGLLDHVQALRDAGETRLFPNGKADAINGQGNWITKAFSAHLARHSKGWLPAKRGFHSLRKTVIQQMQGKGVASEMRAQIVGHELDDEHHAVYSREFTPREKLFGIAIEPVKTSGLAAIEFSINKGAMAPLLEASRPVSK